MSHYVNLGGLATVRAVNMAAGSGGSPNPAKPTPLEFRCDVEKCIRSVVPSRFHKRFQDAYVFIPIEVLLRAKYPEIDSLYILEQKWADFVLGSARHSFEQRLGDMFIKKGLHPVQGHGYFWCERKARK